MRAASQLGLFAGGAATLVIAAGCSGDVARNAGSVPFAASNAAQFSPVRGLRDSEPIMLGRSTGVVPGAPLAFADPDAAHADGKSGSVYVSEFNPSEALMYALPDVKNVAPACSFKTSYVNGIGVNAAGTFYVPQGGINRVTTYAKGTCTPAALILNEPNGQPGDVAFASDGTTYVMDIVDTAGTAGVVSVYQKGAARPSFTLTDSAMTECLGIAVNASNDVFVSYLTSSDADDIIVFKKGKMPGKILHVTGDEFIIGLEFDANQNLIGVDNGADAIVTYAPPYSGAPSRTFRTQGPSVEGKLDANNANLYVGDLTYGTIDVYKYPSGTYTYSISNGLNQALHVIGVAVDPAAPN